MPLRDGTHATVYAYASVEEIDRRGVSKIEREYQRRGLSLHVERSEKSVVNKLMTELSTSYLMTALRVALLRNEIETDLAVSARRSPRSSRGSTRRRRTTRRRQRRSRANGT